MNKTLIKVPKGVRYLSEWDGFTLPNFPIIINKKLTGCGFTEWVIRNDFPTIWCAPRKVLLENKLEQHLGEIYYAKSIYQEELAVDKDLSKPKITPDRIPVIDREKFITDLETAIYGFGNRPIKIEVTYDSYRLVKEVLIRLGIFNSFYTVVDEFQSILGDAPFKSDTELEFLEALKDVQNLAYVSATPLMEDTLDELEEFKYLPYWELDWKSEDPSRIITPDIKANPCRSINKVLKKYITDHKNGKYFFKTFMSQDNIPMRVVEAKELLFYVNSVKNICDAIRQNNLIPEEVNIICADTSENRKKIRESFRKVYESLGRDIKQLPKVNQVIGKVPLKGEPRKPYTFLTKTAYLGADYYSDCARSIVLSDSGIECMALDITLDLPQILGRQRDDENPWKYSAEIWFKLGNGVGDISPEQFQERIDKKMEKTLDLLSVYTKGTSREQHYLAENYQKIAKMDNYRDDYVAVNHHAGSDLKPCVNNLVLVSEKRAYKIQQMDYKDRFSVFSTIESTFRNNMEVAREVQYFLDEFEKYGQFYDKIKYLVNFIENCDSIEVVNEIFKNVPEEYSTYYYTLGPEYILSVGGRKSVLEKALKFNLLITDGEISGEDSLKIKIYENFKEGDRIVKTEIKVKLQEIYNSVGSSQTAKATDLEEWFEIRRINITDKSIGKRVPGFELIKLK